MIIAILCFCLTLSFGALGWAAYELHKRAREIMRLHHLIMHLISICPPEALINAGIFSFPIDKPIMQEPTSVQ